MIDDCVGLAPAPEVLQIEVGTATVDTWEVDHSVRRLIRPVLMRDRKAESDLKYIATGSAT